MNNTTFMLGIVISLLIGGAGGYFVEKSSTDSASVAQIQQMTDMMKMDGTSMEKMGGLMVQAGALVEERGTKYNDQDLIMMGKDLSVSGKKHQMDGASMTGGNMMGMTDNGNMQSMPGMDHSKM